MKNKSVEQIRPLIIVVPIETDDAAMAELRAGGYLPLKADEHGAARIKVLLPFSEVSSGDMLMAALHAVANETIGRAKERFTEELFKRLSANEKKS